MANLGELSVSITADGKSLSVLTKTVQDEMSKAGASIDALGPKATKAAKDTAAIGTETQKAAKLASSSMSEAGKSASSFGSTMKGLAITIGSVFAVGKIIDFTKSVFGLTSQQQLLEKSYTTLLGSSEKAKNMLGEIAKIAIDTPFNRLQIAETTQKLLAFGFQAERVPQMVRDIADATSALGGGQEKFDRIALAIGQIRAKGKLSAEELLQLTEAGIPAYEILQQKLGLNAKQLGNIGNAGISANTAITALLSGIESRYGGAAANATQTLAGRLSNIWDALQMKLIDFGNSVTPVFNTVLDKISDFVINKLPGLLTNLTTLIASLVTILGPLAPIFEKVGGLIISTINSVAGWIKNNEILAGTIAKVVVVVGGLVSIIGPLAAFIGSLWAGISALGTSFVAASAAGTVLATAIAAIGGPVTIGVAAILSLVAAIGYATDGFGLLADKNTEVMDATEKYTAAVEANKKIHDDAVKSAEDYSKQLADLKKKYDDGEISAAQFKAQSKELNGELDRSRQTAEYTKDGMYDYKKAIDVLNSSKYKGDVDGYIRERNEIIKNINSNLQLLETKKALGIASLNERKAAVEASMKIAEQQKATEIPELSGRSGLLAPQSTGVLQQNLDLWNKTSKELDAVNKEIEDQTKAYDDLMAAAKNPPKSPPPPGGAGGGKSTATKQTEEQKIAVDKLKDAYTEFGKKQQEINKLSQDLHDKNMNRYNEYKKQLNEISDKIKKNEEDRAAAETATTKKAVEDQAATMKDYIRNLAEKQVAAEKSIEDLRKKEQEELAISNTDQNKLVEVMEQRTKAEKELAEIKAAISNLSKTDAADQQKILDVERARAGMTDTARAEFDMKEKITAIENEKNAKIKADNATAAEKLLLLEREQKIYEAFQKRTQLTQEQFDTYKSTQQYITMKGEEKNLFDKLATELVSITEQRNKKIAMETEVADAAIALSNRVNEVAMKNIAKLKLEYADLINTINTAVNAQKTLDASQAAAQASSASTVKEYAEGGYTGDGAKYDVAGVVHKGEYVMSQNMLSKMPGIIPTLEGIRTGSQSFDQSRTVAINGPINMGGSVDFDSLIRKAKFIM